MRQGNLPAKPYRPQSIHGFVVFPGGVNSAIQFNQKAKFPQDMLSIFHVTLENEICSNISQYSMGLVLKLFAVCENFPSTLAAVLDRVDGVQTFLSSLYTYINNGTCDRDQQQSNVIEEICCNVDET